jgi:hypothetical protein
MTDGKKNVLNWNRNERHWFLGHFYTCGEQRKKQRGHGVLW